MHGHCNLRYPLHYECPREVLPRGIDDQRCHGTARDRRRRPVARLCRSATLRQNGTPVMDLVRSRAGSTTRIRITRAVRRPLESPSLYGFPCEWTQGRHGLASRTLVSPAVVTQGFPRGRCGCKGRQGYLSNPCARTQARQSASSGICSRSCEIPGTEAL